MKIIVNEWRTKENIILKVNVITRVLRQYPFTYISYSSMQTEFDIQKKCYNCNILAQILFINLIARVLYLKS